MREKKQMSTDGSSENNLYVVENDLYLRSKI